MHAMEICGRIARLLKSWNTNIHRYDSANPTAYSCNREDHTKNTLLL